MCKTICDGWPTFHSMKQFYLIFVCLLYHTENVASVSQCRNRLHTVINKINCIIQLLYPSTDHAALIILIFPCLTSEVAAVFLHGMFFIFVSCLRKEM